MNERKIELTWVCTSCQHRNRGRDKVCAGCGDAKDASETFVMPGDTRSAASVTDPALLAAAKAGADWRCAFCRGDNRALDAACRRCGAQRGTTPANTEHLRKAPVAAQRAARGMGPGLVTGSLLLSGAMVVGVGVLGVLAVLGALLISANRRPRTRPLEPGSSTVQATVVSRAWETTLRESRFCLAPGEGFAEQQPADAIEVTPSGMRHHHDDRIEDGTETQTYFEDVPYQDTETYTEMVPCGEDCVSLPETCSEHCTDDGNGFASCSTTCSGGGQSCTPRTCAETRTRWVTRTRQEQRTRTVPHFRVEPRACAVVSLARAHVAVHAERDALGWARCAAPPDRDGPDGRRRARRLSADAPRSGRHVVRHRTNRDGTRGGLRSADARELPDLRGRPDAERFARSSRPSRAPRRVVAPQPSAAASFRVSLVA